MEGVRAWGSNRGISPPPAGGPSTVIPVGGSVASDQGRSDLDSSRSVLPPGYTSVERRPRGFVKRNVSEMRVFEVLKTQKNGRHGPESGV